MKISTPEAMTEYWKILGKKEKTLLLQGNLGAGKTTLVKGFAESLGIDTKLVQSPTYTYINSYDNKLLHIDMYRLSSFEELVEKGILHDIAQHEYIVIERPKWIDQLDLGPALIVKIEILKEWEREILTERI